MELQIEPQLNDSERMHEAPYGVDNKVMHKEDMESRATGFCLYKLQFYCISFDFRKQTL